MGEVGPSSMVSNGNLDLLGPRREDEAVQSGSVELVVT